MANWVARIGSYGYVFREFAFTNIVDHQSNVLKTTRSCFEARLDEVTVILNKRDRERNKKV